jgi:type I restriction enzyme M protein
LNVLRYVDTVGEDEEVDVQEAQKEIEELEAQLAEARAEMKRYLRELGL